jgi:hypothetical protein
MPATSGKVRCLSLICDYFFCADDSTCGQTLRSSADWPSPRTSLGHSTVGRARRPLEGRRPPRLLLDVAVERCLRGLAGAGIVGGNCVKSGNV